MINKIKQFFKQIHSQKPWQLLINQDRRNFLLVFGLFIIITAAFFAVYKINNKAQAGWWNDTWQYRKKITISSGSSAATNYQVLINDYNTATDITAGKMQSNCSDLRFTSLQGVELPYWIESGCNSSTTDIWVKVDEIPASGGTSIYMYYGNPTAGSASNENNTFIFADDFEENDQNKWLNSYATSSTTVLQRTTTQAYAGNYAGEAYQTVDDGDTAFFITSASLTSAGRGDRILEGQFYDTSSVTSSSIIYENGAIYFGVMTGTSTTHYTYSCGWGAWTATTKARSTGWHRIKHVYSGTTGYLYIDGTLYATCSSLSDGNNIVYGSYWTASSGFYIDNVFMRKYLATEPTVGTPGSEEQGTSPIAYYSFDEGYGTTVHNQIEKNGESGLISWWKMDEGAENTCSGGTNDVCDTMSTVDGDNSSRATWTTASRIGNALSFNGTSSYVDLANSTKFDTQKLTISAWVYSTNYSQNGFIFEKGSVNTQYSLFFEGSNMVFRTYNSVGTQGNMAIPQSTLGISNSNWYLLTATYDGAFKQIYVNGVLKASSAYTETLRTGQTGERIGAYGGGTPGYYFNGTIDSLKVYNRALSASEIMIDYQSTHGHMLNMDPSTDWVEGARQNPQQRPLGKALDFDGSNDYVTVPLSASVATKSNYSISLWANLSSLTGGWIYNENASGGVITSIKLNGDNTLSFCIHNSASWKCATSTTVITTNRWYHYGATLSSSDGMKFYINGKFEDDDANTSPTDQTVASITIGKHAYGDYVTGKIDEIKLYQKALTANEIKTEYNRGAGAVMGAGAHAGTGAAPKGFWKLDEGSGYSAFDVSGNNNTGVLTNMDAESDWVAGKVGKALDFDGTNDYITTSLTSINPSSSAFSASAWVKLNSTSAQQIIVQQRDGSGTGRNLVGFDSSGCGDNKFYSYLGGTCTATNSTYLANVWYHVTVTWDLTTSKIYVNGSLENSATPTAESATGEIIIGIGKDLSSAPMNGLIDHVKVYNYARTPEQIHYDMATGSPVAYYSLDEGKGTTIHNSQEKNGEDGLISWWKFDDASSGTISTAYDEKGVNNGTGSNAIYSTTAKIGNAGYFDGTGDYITVTDNNSLDLANITISAWVRVGTATNFATILGKRDSGSATANYGFRTGTTGSVDELEFYWINSSNWQIYTTTNANLATGTWYYLTATYDGTSVKVYKDGVLLTGSCTTGTCNNALETTNDNFGIGWSGEMGSEYWNGYLDSVKLYNRALSAAEIAADYGSLHGHMINMAPSSDWVEGAKQNLQQRSLGKALDFDGSNDRVIIPYQPQLNFSGRAQYSVSAWIKPTTGGTYQVAVSQSSTSENVFVLGLDNNNMAILGRHTQITGSTAVPLNQWTHIVGTYDGNNLNIYVNGQSDAAPTGDIATKTSLEDVLIGAHRYDSPTLHFTGQIDEVKIYNYTLTANEIKTEYNRGAAMVLGAGKSDSDTAQNNLVAWWKMDEASGFTISDSSKNETAFIFKNATNTTTLWGPGKLGKAAYFEGTSVYAEANNESNFDFERTDPFSISFWLNPSSSFTYYFQELFFKVDSYVGYDIWIDPTGGYIRFDIQSSSSYGNKIKSSAGSIRTNTWQHIVATYDGSGNVSGMSIYVNGIKDTTTVQSNLDTNTILNNFSPRIGVGTGFDWFSGHMDNLKVFSKELSTAEVAWEYNQGAPIYHWDFNEGSGIIAKNTQGKSVTTDGLVGFWTMDSTTVNDISGNGNNLTNSGSPTSATGIKGNAVDYASASSQYSYCTDANCGADLDYQGNGFTISTWVFADSANASKHLTGKHYYTSSTDNGGYLLYTDSDSTFKFILRNSVGTSTQVDIDSAVAASTTSWQHVVGTYDGVTAKIYVNGVLKSSSAYSSGIMNTSSNFGIATHGDGNASYLWDGKIDHTKVWQRALTATEVAIEYGHDEKYGYLTNMDASSDWVNGALPATNRPMLGKALDFDGSNDYIDAGTSVNLANQSFTLSAWAKRGGSGTIDYIIKLGDTYSTNNLLHFGFRDTNYFTCAFYGNYLDSLSTYTDTDWHHWICTYDANTNARKLYRDGMLINSDTASADFQGTGSLHIGRYNTDYYIGQIDEVKIYNYALTANQVKLDYNNSAAVRY